MCLGFKPGCSWMLALQTGLGSILGLHAHVCGRSRIYNGLGEGLVTYSLWAKLSCRVMGSSPQWQGGSVVQVSTHFMPHLFHPHHVTDYFHSTPPLLSSCPPPAQQVLLSISASSLPLGTDARGSGTGWRWQEVAYVLWREVVAQSSS